jgi:hypothetical protein
VAPLFGEYPGAILPRRVVAYMLGVTALEIGDPVPLVVDVEGDDAPERSPRLIQRREAPYTLGMYRSR